MTSESKLSAFGKHAMNEKFDNSSPNRFVYIKIVYISIMNMYGQ